MKRTPLTIGLASLIGGTMLLMLSACTPSTPTEKPAASNFALTENVSLSENPVFNVENITFPEGWSIVESIEAETGVVNSLGLISPEGITVLNGEQTCEFSAAAYNEEAWKANRSDIYNSKNSLYEKGTTETTLVQDEQVITLPSSLGEIEFVSAKFANSVYDDLGNATGQSANRSAIRVFSGLVGNGYEPLEGDVLTGQYGENISEGVPAIDITLSCDTPELLTDELWDSLINTLDITLVTAK